MIETEEREEREELDETHRQGETGPDEGGDGGDEGREGETHTLREEGEPNGEDEQDQKPQEETREPGMTAVLSTTGSIATIGVRREGTDAFLEAFGQLDIEALAEELPGVLARAQIQWEENPLYPKYKKPAKPRAKQGNRKKTAASPAAAAAPAESETAGAETAGAETAGTDGEERAPEPAQQELKLF